MWFTSFTFSLSLSHSLTLLTSFFLYLRSSLSFSIFSLNHCSSPLSIAAFLHPHRLQFRSPHQKPPREWEWTYPEENLTSNLDIDIICISICWFLRHAPLRLETVGWFFPTQHWQNVHGNNNNHLMCRDKLQRLPRKMKARERMNTTLVTFIQIISFELFPYIV